MRLRTVVSCLVAARRLRPPLRPPFPARRSEPLCFRPCYRHAVNPVRDGRERDVLFSWLCSAREHPPSPVARGPRSHWPHPLGLGCLMRGCTHTLGHLPPAF